MSTYKLYYFDVPARGELPRLLLSAVGQKFEDVRIRSTQSDEWIQLKQRMPFGQVPVLEVDGQMIAQEYAISKYIAQEFGLSCKSFLDQAFEDMYVFTSEDIYVRVEEIFHCKDDPEKAAILTKKWVEETGPFYLAKLNESLATKKSPYFMGDKIGYADIAVFSNVSVMEMILPSQSVKLLEDCPLLRRNMELVRSHPNIKAYLERRPNPGT